jgi:hypothetical protein
VEVTLPVNPSAIDTIVEMTLESPAAEIKTIPTPAAPKPATEKTGGGF